SWQDTRDYVAWLSHRTGQHYRLPTELEWEYAARAGTRSDFWWGAHPNHDAANYGAERCCRPLTRGRDLWLYTAPVGSFPNSAFGLHDTAGNVWEWTIDCYTSSARPDVCAAHVLRGGSYAYTGREMRVTRRRSHADAGVSVGFRVARDL